MPTATEDHVKSLQEQNKQLRDLATGFSADLKATRKALEEAASKPASGSGPASLFGGFHTPDLRDGPGGYPIERLKRLQVYDSAALDFYAARQKSNRACPDRLTGLGPYMARVAGLAAQSVGHQGTLQLLRDQGLWPEGYGQEAFLKEYGSHPASSPYVVKGLDGREVRKTALAESSGMTGGYTVPPQWMNELLTIAAEDSFIEPRAKILPMNTRTVQWPMLDITTVQAAGTSPYFGGILAQWQPEAQSINETEPQFRQSEWVAWDLVLYTVSSNQLLADNGIGLDALLSQLFGQAITWYKEFAYLQGKGAGSTMPLGVLNAPATLLQNRVSATSFQLADAAAMMSHLQVNSWDSACWVMHQSVLPQLIQMTDIAATTTGSVVGTQTSGQHLSWLPMMGVNGVGPAGIKIPRVFLNGLPIFFTEKTQKLGTTGDVMLIDWSRYVIGQRLDFQIDVSPHYLFRTNQLAWRVIARADGKPWLNKYITDQTGWQVSPFVCLN